MFKKTRAVLRNKCATKDKKFKYDESQYGMITTGLLNITVVEENDAIDILGYIIVNNEDESSVKDIEELDDILNKFGIKRLKYHDNEGNILTIISCDYREEVKAIIGYMDMYEYINNKPLRRWLADVTAYIDTIDNNNDSYNDDVITYVRLSKYKQFQVQELSENSTALLLDFADRYQIHNVDIKLFMNIYYYNEYYTLRYCIFNFYYACADLMDEFTMYANVNPSSVRLPIGNILERGNDDMIDYSEIDEIL